MKLPSLKKLSTLRRFRISFEPLGFLEGGTFSRAYGISANGRVVVGTANSSFSSLDSPFIWTADSGMQSLGSISGTEFSGFAKAVSDDSRVVVGQSESLAFRWTATIGRVNLGSLSGAATSVANDVSADGHVVVGDSEHIAFRWTKKTGMVSLGEVSNANANAVSANGGVVSGRCVAGGFGGAAIWTEDSGWRYLDPGKLLVTNATAISARGSVVVGEWDNAGGPAWGAFRWTKRSGVVLLGHLGKVGQAYSPDTIPSDISSDGYIWVGCEKPRIQLPNHSLEEAVICDPFNGMQALKDLFSAAGIDLTDWVALRAEGVSFDGATVTIAGWGTRTNETEEAWIGTITIPNFILRWLRRAQFIWRNFWRNWRERM